MTRYVSERERERKKESLIEREGEILRLFVQKRGALRNRKGLRERERERLRF
jgi:hypothetical protein